VGDGGGTSPAASVSFLGLLPPIRQLLAVSRHTEPTVHPQHLSQQHRRQSIISSKTPVSNSTRVVRDHEQPHRVKRLFLREHDHEALSGDSGPPRNGYTGWIVSALSCRACGKDIGVQGTGLPVWQARKCTLVCALVAAMVAVVTSYFFLAGREADVPQYQRRAASQAACEAAAAEISRLRLQSPIKFVDDCLQPKITPVSNKPGHLIVTRVVEMQIGRGTTRKTYSALMDGRRVDGWRMIQVESAPNELSVVLWPGGLAETNEVAEHQSPTLRQSH
jgi:hypothetical protein